MIYLKQGVKLARLTPQILLAVAVADQVYSQFDTPLVITSANDGRHMYGSYHYQGKAIDCRTRNLPSRETDAIAIAAELRGRLGPDYDIVVERDHIHIEYDPKS